MKLTYLKILRLPHQLFCLVPLLLGILDSNSKLLTTNPLTHFSIFWFTLGFFFASTAGFVINEYIDSFDTDQFSSDTRASKSRKLDKNIVLIILIFLIFLSLFFLYLSGSISFVLGITSLGLMFAYSAPPLRMKRYPFWDIATQMVAWGVIPYTVPFLITGTPISWFALIFMLLFLSGAALLAPTLDISADQKVQINNTTVALGYKKSLMLGFWLIFLALLIDFLFVYYHIRFWYWFMIPGGMLALGVYGYARGNWDRPKVLDEFLLLGKRWAKYAGWILFIFLVILAL